ncbi:hypothetical protein [Novosphingobium sp.]|uniref:hypothetical protein n=1 Tax=Novosphingobium sp. TaxID=1874826 RepID=UPI00352A7F97
MIRRDHHAKPAGRGDHPLDCRRTTLGPDRPTGKAGPDRDRVFPCDPALFEKGVYAFLQIHHRHCEETQSTKQSRVTLKPLRIASLRSQ